MNRETKLKYMLPAKIDSFCFQDKECKEVYIEYDGWHFEGTPKKAINSLLKYIFNGGEE